MSDTVNTINQGQLGVNNAHEPGLSPVSQLCCSFIASPGKAYTSPSTPLPSFVFAYRIGLSLVFPGLTISFSNMTVVNGTQVVASETVMDFVQVDFGQSRSPFHSCNRPVSIRLSGFINPFINANPFP